MEALRQIVQLHSDTLVLKVPETFAHQWLEVIVLPTQESTDKAQLSDGQVPMQQIQTELAEFRQRFDETHQFSDSVELVREDREC
jgi:hypothetical protein